MRKRMHDRDSCTSWLTEQPLVRFYSQLYPSVVGGLERALKSAGPDASRAIEALLAAARLAENRAATRLTEELGLSPAEASLASHLVEGGSIKSYAEQRGVKLETARTQLRSTFAKLGVRRQSELVAAVIGPRTR